jgi:hypothetical protein
MYVLYIPEAVSFPLLKYSGNSTSSIAVTLLAHGIVAIVEADPKKLDQLNKLAA